MDENLVILADYIQNVYGKNKITHIWQKEVQLLFDNDKVDKVYEIYEDGYIGAWYYIVSKRNMRYIVKHILNDGNTKLMMASFLYEKRPIKININLLSIIYNYDKLTVYNKLDGSKFKVLAINNKYSLIEEISNDKTIYMIIENGVSGTFLKFSNLIIAVNIFYKDFDFKEEKQYG